MLGLLILVVVMAFAMIVGLIKSRAQRQVDRPHFAAFVGFSAGVVSLAATIISMIATIVWFPATKPQYYYHPMRQDFVAVFATIGTVSTCIAFIAGLLSYGTRRIALVVFGPVMGLIYILRALTNFGS